MCKPRTKPKVEDALIPGTECTRAKVRAFTSQMFPSALGLMSEFHSVSLSTPCRALCKALDKKEPFFFFYCKPREQNSFSYKKVGYQACFHNVTVTGCNSPLGHWPRPCLFIGPYKKDVQEKFFKFVKIYFHKMQDSKLDFEIVPWSGE